MSEIRVGIDIGGTFTDIVFIDENGSRYFGKTLTTYPDPSLGFLEGLDKTLKRNNFKYEEISTIIHGTTLVTNSLIERRGAKTALLTTEGFRDTLEIGTENRFDMFDLMIDKPEILVPRELRFTVHERIKADGSILEPLDEEETRKVLEKIKSKGVEALAVCLLHSYVNSVHEKRIKEIAAEVIPDIKLSISSEVSPEIREYPRTSTTVANVFVQPQVEIYLTTLEEKLRSLGFTGKFHMMLSSGGTCTIETACKFPIRILESGPVGGTIAGAFFSKLSDINNMLAFDMGGTTAKTSLVDKGIPLVTNDFEVGRQDRFKKGSGMPIKSAVIEMIEIGAGGGSIAHINRMGMLNVGPKSASSTPGPVCYGRGGIHPTITDADLVLGYLNPDYFLGGEMKLDVDAAKEAIRKEIAEPLGIDVVDAAWGIHRLVNENMADASRIHAIEKGIDVRKYAMFATGGAGPVHAGNVAKLLDIKKIVSPVGAGVCSAFGFLSTPLSFDFVRNYHIDFTHIDWNKVMDIYKEMETEGKKVLADSGVDEKDIRIIRSCEMRYSGQNHDIRVDVPNGELSKATESIIRDNFTKCYKELFSRAINNLDIEAVTWRLVVKGPEPVLDLNVEEDYKEYTPDKKNDRMVYFDEYKEYRITPVYDRKSLKPGAYIKGPAIVEETESTFVVAPIYDVHLDKYSNLIIERNEYDGE